MVNSVLSQYSRNVMVTVGLEQFPLHVDEGRSTPGHTVKFPAIILLNDATVQEVYTRLKWGSIEGLSLNVIIADEDSFSLIGVPVTRQLVEEYLAVNTAESIPLQEFVEWLSSVKKVESVYSLYRAR